MKFEVKIRMIEILFVISLIICILCIRGTYAKYQELVDTNYNVGIKKWLVTVNGDDISSGAANLTFGITDDYLYFAESNLVETGYIAPGMEAYIDVVIDATATQVPVRYDMQIGEVTQLKIGEDYVDLPEAFNLEIVSIEESFEKGTNGSQKDTTTEKINQIDIENRKITGVIPENVSKNGYKDRVRIGLKWTDDNEAYNGRDTMLGNARIGNFLGYSTGSNEIDAKLASTITNNDTTVASTRPNIVIPVSLQIVQYMGEEITVENIVVTTP